MTEADPGFEPHSPEESLWYACTHGHLDVVRGLLNLGDIDVNRGDSVKNRTPLYRAAGHGHHEIVRLLLQDPRVDANKANSLGCTPFYIAAQEGHLEVTQALLSDPRVDVNLAMTGGYTPFSAACAFNRVEVVKELIAAEPRVDLRKATSELITPFMRACYRGGTEVVRLLLGHFGDADHLNAQNTSGATALFFAVLGSQHEVVEALMQDDRIDPEIVSCIGNTPFQLARLKKELGLVQVIMAYSRQTPNLEAPYITKTRQEFEDSPEIADLISRFKADEKSTKQMLWGNREIGKRYAAEVFALTVFLCDSYLTLMEE